MAKRETPASREELGNELGLSGEEQLEALRRRLRAMERDGQLVFTRRQCYALPERLDLLRGTVIGHRDGYGFLRVEGSKDDLYLSAEQMKMAIHGDVVLAQALGADRKGRREARIVRVLVPKTSQIVGRFFMDAGTGFVVPDDSRLSFDILIPADSVSGARMGFMVVVELTQRPTRRTKAVGKIVGSSATRWAPAWRWTSRCAPMRSPYGRRRWKSRWPISVSRCRKRPRRAASICASCRWSPSTVKTHATSMTPCTARKTWRRLAPVGRDRRRQLLRAPAHRAGR